MRTEEINRLKSVSIRGRIAYGLLCLENLNSKLNNDQPELEQLINNLWRTMNSDNLGWWQNEYIENNPKTMIADYELMISGNVAFEQIGLETIKTKTEFIERIAFLKQLKNPIPEVLDKLCDIANQNISAGTGEFSELTLNPTIELIEIIEGANLITLPKIDIVEFSKFSENNGWGDSFERQTVEQRIKNPDNN
jgi:hypothetical protein